MIKRVNMRIELLTQLSHIGDEKTGSTPVLRTMTIFKDGRHIRIPYISGNAIRGLMRRLLMHDFFEVVGVEPSTKLYHVFFAGGILERGQESEIDIAFKRKVRDTIPPLALFGAAFSNQMIQGSLVVEHAIPIARETAHFIRFSGGLIEEDIDNAKYPIRTFTDIEFFTRRDDLGRDEGDDVVQMKVEHEVLIAGTVLVSGFVLRHASELEVSCLAHALDLLSTWGAVGGKSSVGLGRIAIKTDIDSDSQKYIEFVRNNRDEIKFVLFEMNKRLEK